jgi:diketogulonate reductase-like aldo/keto reductase
MSRKLHFLKSLSHEYCLQLHPFCQQKPIVEYCTKNNIVIQAYCPIIRGRMDDPVIQEVSKKVLTPCL